MRLARGPIRHALKHNSMQHAAFALGNAAIAQPTFTVHSASAKFHSTVALGQTLDFPVKEIGKVERTLKALDMALVRQIKAELMEVDANSDGRQVALSPSLKMRYPNLC
jgi:hypothetical protein